MSRNFRSVVIATAVTLFVTVFGAEVSGARAENQVQIAATAPVVPVQGPVFVAEEVVQPLAPEEPAQSAETLAQLIESMPGEELSGDLRCLAQAVYFEARGEPIEGQLAVAQVVINRSQSGRYPSEYCSVVAQPAQFSFVKRGVIPQPDAGSRAWLRAKAIAQIAHQGLWDCEAKDALYFHATYVKPGWARQKTQLAQIDTHIFYR